MKHHVRFISQPRELPRMALEIQPPQTIWGKIAQLLGLKEF
jgi:hypothetical protein